MIAVIGWTALIFFSSTSLAGRLSEQAFDTLSTLLFQGWQSAPGLYHPIHLIADKGVHVSLFAVFAVLLWKALPDLSHKLGYVILAGTVVGCCSEFLQRFFPGRDPAWRDVCINAAATILGALISLWWLPSNTQAEPLSLAGRLGRRSGEY
jgi:VanZ family protein